MLNHLLNNQIKLQKSPSPKNHFQALPSIVQKRVININNPARILKTFVFTIVKNNF